MKARGGPSRRQRERVERLRIGRPASVESADREQAPQQASTPLVDIIDRIPAWGLVLDAWARQPIAGLDVLTIDAHMLVASCEQYLRYAEAMAQHPLVALPASLSVETAYVVDAPPPDPIEDGAPLLGPGAPPT